MGGGNGSIIPIDSGGHVDCLQFHHRRVILSGKKLVDDRDAKFTTFAETDVRGLPPPSYCLVSFLFCLEECVLNCEVQQILHNLLKAIHVWCDGKKGIEVVRHGDVTPNCVITGAPLLSIYHSLWLETLFSNNPFLAPDLRLSLSFNYNGYECSPPCAEYQYSAIHGLGPVSRRFTFPDQKEEEEKKKARPFIMDPNTCWMAPKSLSPRRKRFSIMSGRIPWWLKWS